MLPHAPGMNGDLASAAGAAAYAAGLHNMSPQMSVAAAAAVAAYGRSPMVSEKAFPCFGKILNTKAEKNKPSAKSESIKST